MAAAPSRIDRIAIIRLEENLQPAAESIIDDPIQPAPVILAGIALGRGRHVHRGRGPDLVRGPREAAVYAATDALGEYRIDQSPLPEHAIHELAQPASVAGVELGSSAIE